MSWNQNPRRAAGIAPFQPDPTVEAAQRDFNDAGTSADTWALKPTESVCKSCWLVQPCDCGSY